MILSRLKNVIYSHFFFLLLAIVGVSAPRCFAGDGIAPERNISMIRGEPGSPEWKVLWDKARNFVRDENYLLAANTYSELYRLKPNIEEANWEYCKVLLKVADFSTAAKIIGGLIEKDPNNSEYLLAGAAVAMYSKNYVAAVDYYGRVLEKDPGGANSDAALLGLATGLRSQGKKELAFGLFEQYSLRHPENSAVIHTLAVDAHELGKDDKARQLYAQLLENRNVDDQIIFEAAQVFDAPGYEKRRSELWREYIIRHPDYMPFRQRLAQYYMDDGSFEAALLQLKYLVDNNENNDVFLLAAGKICQEDLHRPDRALFFYERYLQKHPEDVEVQQQIAGIQLILAGNFLPVVKKDGADQLWAELGAITPNRQAIYLEMADLLEKKGRSDQLIDVLTTLYKNSVQEDDIALRLAQQYYKKAQYKKTIEYLSAVTAEKNKTKSFYLTKGDSERYLGLEMQALVSFTQALSIDPHDFKLRQKCLELAGKMGNGDTLQSLFAGGKKHSDEGALRDFVFVYLDLLAYNFLFEEYALTNNWAKERFTGSLETRTRLDMHMAASLRKEGKTRQAEQLLRQLLLQDVLIEDVLLQLAENAVHDKQINAAKSWFQELLKRSGQLDAGFSYDSQGAKLLLLQIEILQAEKDYEKGQQLIDNYREAAAKSSRRRELAPFLVGLEKRQCWLSYSQGEVETAYQQCEMLVNKGPFDPELIALLGILSRKLQKSDEGEILDSKVSLDGHAGVNQRTGRCC